METILESAIATGNAWIVFVVVLGIVVVYLWKSLEEKHKQSEERITKLEDKYDAEHEAYLEATNKFAETIQEINSTLVAKVENILDELGVGDGEDEEVGE